MNLNENNPNHLQENGFEQLYYYGVEVTILAQNDGRVRSGQFTWNPSGFTHIIIAIYFSTKMVLSENI